MQIIPVIDLKNGRVVHAKQGRRDKYEPIKSALCQSAEIFDILAALLDLHPYALFYIADLDAITRRGDNAPLISKVLLAYPRVTFWVDSGYPLDNADYRLAANYVPVWAVNRLTMTLLQI
jgi:phosphoribosylformimino-5-aminoimidazole carboxamide ribotide isomerase